MKIAIHVGSQEWGGAEQQLARLGAALRGAGHSVQVYCNRQGHAERFRAAGVAAEVVPLGGDAALLHAVRFARALRRFAPDALLVGTYKKLWLAGIAARLARVRRVLVQVVLQTDTPRNLKYRIALRRLVDAVVVNAGEQAGAFAALPGWSAARVHTIYNYYEPAPPAAGSVRTELGLAAAARVVGTVARLAPQKKLERLLDAVAGLPGVQCVLAGDGPRRVELEARARDLGIAERVHFLGHRDDVPAVLAALDVFVICSDREGMSNAMMEAMAAGVPVVSTPVSGAREALEPLADGNAPGTIVAGDPQALRSAMGAILDSAAHAAAMGRAGRARMAERFAPDVILGQWVRVLAGE